MPTNTITNILFTGALFLISAAASIALLLKYWERYRQQQAEVQPPTTNEKVAQLLKSQLELQEHTLQHISQEIHDNIGQALTFVKLNINTIDLHKLEETQNKLTESKLLITKAIQDLRNLAKTLNTDFITEAGLAASIKYQLHFLEQTGVYTTSFNEADELGNCPPETELILFRVVQELLNNIVKHAEASAIEVCLQTSPLSIRIMVSDNGKGFLPAQLSWKKGEKGLGLGNMKKRIDIMQGTFNLVSMPGKGTCVTIEVPHKMEYCHQTANRSSNMYNYLPA